MNPREKYGTDFYYKWLTFKRADGVEVQFHEIALCIEPKKDAVTTLAYAWEALRELATWACDEFKDRPQNETYRIVVGWSERVRHLQGQIFKVWVDGAGVREVATMKGPEECSLRFGAGWTPLPNWEKDVFKR
jgi:hypothetical protein